MLNSKQKKLAEEAKKGLLEDSVNPDIEAAHCNACDRLCKLLNELGLEDVVEAYNKVDSY